MENTFINKNSFDKRVQESTNIKEKYTDRIPIIVEKHHTCNLPEIDKCKYLVPKDMTMSQFIFVIRKRIKLNSNQALFFYTFLYLKAFPSVLGKQDIFCID